MRFQIPQSADCFRRNGRLNGQTRFSFSFVADVSACDGQTVQRVSWMEIRNLMSTMSLKFEEEFYPNALSTYGWYCTA